MDEHREEREELEAIVREDEDDAREQMTFADWWQSVEPIVERWTRGDFG